MTPSSLPTTLSVHITTKRFRPAAGSSDRPVLADLAFTLAPGSFTALTGPSGVGKTSLLNLVAGLDRDFAGEIAASPGLRLGYVFQEPRLLPWRTVEANVRLALAGAGQAVDPAWLDRLFLAAGLADARGQYPTRLSLGMARRAALVRAFALRPTLLLMDEPFVSLDEPTALRLRQLLHRLLEENPATVLFVTHALHEAVRLADRLLVLDGRPAGIVADLPIGLDGAGRTDRLAVELAVRELDGRLSDVSV